MPKVVFTSNLKRHIDAPPSEVSGATVGDVLDAVFVDNPRLRGYVLDDQDRIRHHVVVFVDGERADLGDRVSESSEVFVLQALSGGSPRRSSARKENPHE
jgi:molybdopterin synthase sulfur carrier subunit